MSEIRLSLDVAAPPERCFDLARSVELHQRSTAATSERAAGGVTAGLLGPDQGVTWEARHVGVQQVAESETWRDFLPSMPFTADEEASP